MFLCNCCVPSRFFEHRSSLARHRVRFDSSYSGSRGFEKKCIRCDILFLTTKVSSKYCSKSCSQPKISRSCLYCGNIARRFYCSTKCQHDHQRIDLYRKVENGECSNPRMLKKYLIEKHGNKCMDPECAWDFEKRKVNVELEHRDGDSSNNNLSNLLLLCPGCHSLTPTYKSKNRGNGRSYRRQRYAEGKSY